MLVINKLNKSYGKNFTLSIENLDLNHSNVIALLGPNGSGKTTLIKILLGLVKPKVGDITYFGSDIFRDYRFRNDLSYMPQSAIYPGNLKVSEIIGITKSLKADVTEYDTELFDTFRLQNVLEMKFSSLSQGTKQKIAASIVFMFNSKIIILDEPTAGLDPYASKVLKEKILKEKTNKLIIFTTHIMSDVIDVADRLIFLYEGRLKLERSVTENYLQTGGRDFIADISDYFKT